VEPFQSLHFGGHSVNQEDSTSDCNGNLKIFSSLRHPLGTPFRNTVLGLKRNVLMNGT
jgi:hypothetical protein